MEASYKFLVGTPASVYTINGCKIPLMLAFSCAWKEPQTNAP